MSVDVIAIIDEEFAKTMALLAQHSPAGCENLMISFHEAVKKRIRDELVPDPEPELESSAICSACTIMADGRCCIDHRDEEVILLPSGIAALPEDRYLDTVAEDRTTTSGDPWEFGGEPGEKS